MRVLFNLKTIGNINGKEFSAVRLDQDVLLHSPITFHNITVDSFAANGLTSGINFNDWVNQALKKVSENTQIVSGNWAIQDGTLSSLFGNAMVNNAPAAGLLQRLTADGQHLQSMSTFLNATHKTSCDELKAHVDLANAGAVGAMTLQFFDFATKISHDWKVNSIHSLAFDSSHFLIINAGCQSYLYAWQSSSSKFTEVASFNSGIVNTWMHILNGPESVFLISNGIDGTKSCPESGLNIWTLQLAGSVIVHSHKIPDDLLSIQIKPNSTSNFYGMRRNGSHVLEYDLSGAVVDRWEVSKDSMVIPRFIPAEANMGLAVSDGKTISVLQTSRSLSNERATTLEDVNFNAAVDCASNPKLKRCQVFKTNSILGKENPFKMKPFAKCNLQQKFNEFLQAAAPKMKEKLLLPKVNFVAIKRNESNEGGVGQATVNESKKKDSNSTSQTDDAMVGATAGDIGHIVTDIIRIVGDIVNDDFDYDIGSIQNETAADSIRLEPTLTEHGPNNIEDKIEIISNRIVDRILDYIWSSIERDNDKINQPSKPSAATSEQKHLPGHESDLSPADIRLSEKIVVRASQLLSERINASIFTNKTCENATQPDNNIVGDALGQISETAVSIADRIADQVIAAMQEDRDEEVAEEESVNENVGDAFGDAQEKATHIADDLTDRLIEYLQNREESDYTPLLDIILSSPQNMSQVSAPNGQSSINAPQNQTKRGRSGIVSTISAVQSMITIGKSTWKAIKWLGKKITRSRAGVGLPVSDHANHTDPGQSGSSANQRRPAGDAVIGNIISSRVLTTENRFLPPYGRGELLALNVGPWNKVLYAISVLNENVVKGDHDNILVCILISTQFPMKRY